MMVTFVISPGETGAKTTQNTAIFNFIMFNFLVKKTH